MLTVPWGRRTLLARNLARGVLALALREFFAWVRAQVSGAGQTGAVTVNQRFGSALNLNLRYHPTTDGGGSGSSHRWPTDEVRPEATTVMTVLLALASLAKDVEPDLPREEPPIPMGFVLVGSGVTQEAGEIELSGAVDLNDAPTATLAVELGLQPWLQVEASLPLLRERGCTLCELEPELEVGIGFLGGPTWWAASTFGTTLSSRPTLAAGLHGTVLTDHVYVYASVEGEWWIKGEKPEAVGSLAAVLPLGGRLAPRVEASWSSERVPTGALGVSIWPAEGAELGLAGSVEWQDGALVGGAHLAISLEGRIWGKEP